MTLILLQLLIEADGELDLASYLCQEAKKSLSLSLTILRYSNAAQVASEKKKSIHEDYPSHHVKLIRGHKIRTHKDLSGIVTSDPFFDGYRWRKYGQKTIKNSMFQRTYYKCRNGGCKATKTVQQIDCGKPPNFLVSYDMQHKCKVTEANQNLKMDSITSSQVLPPIIESNSLMKNIISKLEETSSPNSLFQNNMSKQTSSPNSHFQNNMNQDCSNSLEETKMTQAQAFDTYDHLSGIFMPQMFSPLRPILYSDEEIESAWLMGTSRSRE
ncbi:hypothetical protein J5N97_003766 [Dioscorea zingiberensis]|uniref:WRKY domain-containing protein n=1 Tax=Dioscorea zingiberensis TaxID=325984 RepID=A0A9D5HQD7_9LILI|nr:hypothetical protein J5N97_003766 [Dioscorea zingiberensis]